MQQEYKKNKEYLNLYDIQILMEKSTQLFEQRIILNASTFNQSIQMHDPIAFDFSMIEFQNSLKDQLQRQIEYFKYLCSDYFNLEELTEISKNNLKGIHKIKVLQRQLYEINPNDLALSNLSSVFQHTLDFYYVSPQTLRQRSQQQKKQQQQQQIDQKIQVDIFSSSNCSIYCSLINKNIEISRTSSNFSNIFEVDQIRVIGKQVSNLLPKLLFQMHEMTLNDFINFGNTGSIFSTSYRYAFALNGNGFVFPIKLYIKMENFSDDFGITALVSKVEDSKQYIFFNEQFQISDISSIIFEQIFSKEYSHSQLKNQLIFNFIPLLKSLLNENTLKEGKYYNTCLFLRKRVEINTYREMNMQLNDKKQTVQKNEIIFSIIFQIKNLESRRMKDVRFLEIIQFQEETSVQGKYQQLNMLGKSLSLEYQLANETQNDIQQENEKRKIQNDKYQKQISNKEEILQKSQQKLLSSLKTGSKINIEMENQPNLYTYNQLSNRSSVYLNNRKVDDMNQSKKFFSNNNYNTSIMEIPEDQQDELNYKKYETYTSQIQMDVSNKPKTPSANSYLNVYQDSPNGLKQMNKSKENLNSKKEKLLRSISQLNQNQKVLQKISTETHLSSNNLENYQLKYATCDLNQVIREKLFESPSNIEFYQNNIQQIQSQIGYDECSIQDQIQSRNKICIQSSSGKSIKEISKQNQRFEEQQQSTLTGSQNTQISMKKIIAKKLSKNSFSGTTRIIACTGFFSIIILYAFVLIFYFSNMNKLNVISEQFNKVNVVNAINEGVQWFTKEQQFGIDANLFSSVLGIDKEIVDPNNPSKNTTVLQQIQKMSRQQQQKAVQDFSKNVNKILHSYNEKLFDYIKSTEIQISSNYMEQQIFSSQNRSNSILYTMMIYQSSLNQLYLKEHSQDLYPQSIIFGNIQNFNNAMLQIQGMISSELQTSYDQLKNNQLQQFIQTLICAFLLINIAVPFLIHFKKQEYQVIKLLGSFPPSVLQQYKQLFQLYLNRIELQQRKDTEIIQKYQSQNGIFSKRSISMKQASQFDFQKTKHENNQENSKSKKQIKKLLLVDKKGNIQKRQRQIASFSKTKPFSLKYILISLLLVSPFMVYPVFNMITIDKYVDVSLDTLSQRNIILNSSQFILNFEVIHYKIWEMALDNILIKKISFYNYGFDVIKYNDGVLQSMQSLTSFENSQSYDSDSRKQYFESLLLDSSCTYIDKINNNTITKPYLETNFTGDQCRKMLSGGFERGYILAFQHLTNLYSDWFSTYEKYAAIQTPENPLFQNVTQNIIDIQLSENNIIDIYQSNLLLQQISSSFEKFFENQNENYTNFIVKMFTILLILQMILIFLAISIVWTTLYKKFQKEIHEFRLLLTNMHIDIILENKLIYQYLKIK